MAGTCATAAATRGSSAATESTWPPEYEVPQSTILGIDPGQGAGVGHGRVVVGTVPSPVDELARVALGGAEAAVVEQEHVQAGGGEALRVGHQAAIARVAEPMRHHDARASVEPHERVSLAGEVPGGAPISGAWERQRLHASSVMSDMVSDISSQEFWALPPDEREPAFAALRRDDPVSWQRQPEGQLMPQEEGSGGYWAVVRYEDVRTVSRDPETFCSGRGVMFEDVPEELLEASQSFLAMDAPRHKKLRGLVSAASRRARCGGSRTASARTRARSSRSSATARPATSSSGSPSGCRS